jgi:hypothetical protein
VDGSSSSGDGSSYGTADTLQQQQVPDSTDLSGWQRLESAAAVPTLQQLLLLLEAALLDPLESCGPAVELFSRTASVLHAHGCLAAAVPELLPPVLHMLPLAMQYVLPQPEQLEYGDPTEMCDEYAFLVSQLLAAGGLMQHAGHCVLGPVFGSTSLLCRIYVQQHS